MMYDLYVSGKGKTTVLLYSYEAELYKVVGIARTYTKDVKE